MPFLLFDHTSAADENTFRTWTQSLQTQQRAKLNAKLDMLSKHGCELFPNTLTGTDTPGILKLRVKGGVQLRPMLCKGPVNQELEFTLLLGAKEVGGKLQPLNADELANDLKAAVIADPQLRRKNHERVS